MLGKPLIFSKTFWSNIIMAALAVTSTVPVNKTTALVGLGLNIALRVISGQPITSIFGPGGATK